MTPLLGRLYQYKNAQTTGYFMVMSKGPAHVELSPLFWRDEVVTFHYSRSAFDTYFERIEQEPTVLGNPSTCGKYDKECHRRWKIIKG